jgi:hypothetical protein
MRALRCKKGFKLKCEIRNDEDIRRRSYRVTRFQEAVRKCFVCGKGGHIARNCDSRKSEIDEVGEVNKKFGYYSLCSVQGLEDEDENSEKFGKIN